MNGTNCTPRYAVSATQQGSARAGALGQGDSDVERTSTRVFGKVYPATGRIADHEGADILLEAVILSARQESLRAPALRLLPGIVHGLQAAGQVGVLGDVLAADLVIRCHPPRHHRHH